ncbi:MAG: insulinase family protein, partial [Lachnospiraceae bacterium]|nr:insulinase family protein [Lachnospiraceae bacterium]
MEIKDLKAYEIVEEHEVGDLHSQGMVLRHKKTGAKVALLMNDDENKVFSIAFRTPPKDSTGVAHIVEHTVLCGSEKYPLKDPFVELAKGSLNTFLNAMTYPDKTVYPVASCNFKDLCNLMDVYLDAVFYPNIYKEERIFRQEGWHYELEGKEGELSINGVVYNEMKGAFSNPDDVLSRMVMNSLYPDTTYGIESGGDPEVIPSLTYQDYLDFHRKYYHPSNSYIYLYGDMDMSERLDYLD